MQRANSSSFRKKRKVLRASRDKCLLVSFFPLKIHMIQCWISVCFNQKCQIRNVSGRLKTSIAFSCGSVERPPGSHTRRESWVLNQEEVERKRTFASLAAARGSWSHCCWNPVRFVAFVMLNSLSENSVGF